MRTSFEKIYGKLLQDETPSRQYIGLKIVDVEEDEAKAERLNEVSAVSDQQEDFLTTTLDPDGAVKIKKGLRDSNLPRTPEQLRSKLRLMGNMWCFLFLRFRKSWLSDVNPEVFRRYADFLLGSKVFSMPLPESSSYRLPWNIVLTYELELRREAFKRINDEGLTMGDALTAVCRDTYLRDVHLVAPATLAAASAHSTSSGASGGGAKRQRSRTPNRPGGKGRGGKKGGGSPKGGGKGMKKLSEIELNAQKLKSRFNKRLICFKYNNKEETCDGRCNMLHICQWCLDAHPKYECPKHKD
eukprot:3152001-Karenia_brevis.AAC.1